MSNPSNGATQLLDRYAQEYRDRTPKSSALYEKARARLPGGAGRNATMFWPNPIYADHGEGAYLIDIDDNRYVDLSLDGGSCILGHASPEMVAACQEQLTRGSLLAMATEAEVRLAERLNAQMPFLEMIRFLNTGSEPEQIALRIARAFTGREKFARVEGHHHGQSDFMLHSHIGETAGPDLAPETVSDDPGVPASLSQYVITIPFNETEAAVSIIEQNADDLACVMIEPMMMWGGSLPAQQEYLDAIRDVTQRLGILMIVDEIPLGVRFGPAGAIGEYGIAPDMWTTGKALFGGIAHGMLGGRADVFEKVVAPPYDPAIKVFCSGTFSANPMAMTAAHIVLDAMEDGSAVEYMDALTQRLGNGLLSLAEEYELPFQFTGKHSVFAIHLTDRELRTFRDVKAGPQGIRKAFYTGLMARGILWPPGRPTGTLSTAHTEADIDTILEASDSVLKDIKKAWDD